MRRINYIAPKCSLDHVDVEFELLKASGDRIVDTNQDDMDVDNTDGYSDEGRAKSVWDFQPWGYE